jgi:hypothetical protein
VNCSGVDEFPEQFTRRRVKIAIKANRFTVY